MTRREFVTLLCAGAAVAAMASAARAQQPTKVYKIGIFSAGAGTAAALGPRVEAAFFEALQEFGWIEGKNIVFEHRYANNRLERLPELAAELVRLKVDIIVTNGTLAPLAARQATSTIPIVMTNSGDPIGSRLVASLARPGGNVTGLSAMAPDLGAKRLELLKEFLPGLSRVAVLWNTANPDPARGFKETVAAAQTLGIEIYSLEVGNPADFDNAYELMVRQQPQALMTIADPLTTAHRKQIAGFAAKNRLPSLASIREFADAGILLTYGPNIADLRRRAAGYVDKIDEI